MSAGVLKFASGCTHESHEALKLDDAAWLAQTYEIGPVMHGLELKNCTACHSTLAREIDDNGDALQGGT